MVSTSDAVKAKLAERIAFFFSDANFSKDEFMLREASNNDGYIEISSLLRFNSIKKISTEMAIVAEAAKTVDSVVVSKDGEAIRRKDPLPDKNDAVTRTIFVANVPTEEIAPEVNEDAKKEDEEPKNEEEVAREGEEPKKEEGEEARREEPKKKNVTKRFAVSIDDVKASFDKFGKVAIARPRYSKSNPKFKIIKSALGSFFVEFDSAESYEKAVSNTEEVKVGDNVVTVKPMTEWLEENKKNKEQGRNNKRGKKDNGDKKGASGDGSAAEPAAEKELVIEPMKWEKKCVIAFTRFTADTKREDIKSAFAEVEGVPMDDIYIDFSMGSKDGFVRFSKTFDIILDVAQKFDKGEVKVKGEAVGSACVLLDQEEEKYWEDAARQSAERKRAFEARGGRKHNKKQRRN